MLNGTTYSSGSCAAIKLQKIDLLAKLANMITVNQRRTYNPV